MEQAEKKNLIILTGPTAVGKTALSLKLAKAVNGEIISADSIQVYKGFDIGSAKITKEEMQGVRHHLIDVLEPRESFSVACFQKMASEKMQEIYERGAIPVITGGTGFYIQALLYQIDFKENTDDGYRKKLEELYRNEGKDLLYRMLSETDPESAEAIDKNNVKRVIRALEYHHQTGERISVHNRREREKESPYRFAYFVLNCDRKILYERIEERVDEMIKNGLVEEVRFLTEKYGLTKDMVSMQGLGYKEILQYLNGELSLSEAVSLIKKNTRHFAKRQLTWFRREKDVIWVDKDALQSEEEQIAFILDELNKRGITGGLS